MLPWPIARACVWLWLLSNQAVAQPFGESLPRYQPLNLNPALAAEHAGIRAGISSLQRWRSAGQPIRAQQAWVAWSPNASKQAKTQGRLGAGLHLVHQSLPDAMYTQTNLAFSAAYRLPTGQNSALSAALAVRFQQHHFQSNWQWGSQFNGYIFDATLPSGEIVPAQAIAALGVGAGVVWQGRTKVVGSRKSFHLSNYEVGLAVRDAGTYELSNQALSSFEYTPSMQSFLQANWLYRSDWLVAPQIYALHSGWLYEIMGGFELSYVLVHGTEFHTNQPETRFGGGMHYRSGNDLIISALGHYSGWELAVGYSLHFGDFKEAAKHRGGMQLSLTWRRAN